MKIHIVSDLHTEFGPPKPEFPLADVSVFAGDIGLGLGGLRWIEEKGPKGKIIYVPGNHEYYRHSIPKLTEELKWHARQAGIYVLEQDVVEIGGIRFLGCTLWTDFRLFGEVKFAVAIAENNMNDYRQIRLSPSYRRLRPADTALIHQKSRAWLEKVISDGRTEEAVIITHHAPSSASLNLLNEFDIVSAAYASNMDELVKRSKAKLWIHGHTHYCVDYIVGETRIISNQHGYEDGSVGGFRTDLVVEV